MFRRPAVTIGPMEVMTPQISLLDARGHEPRKVILRQSARRLGDINKTCPRAQQKF
jgi:hypothetical protein